MDEKALQMIRALIANMEANAQPDRVEALIACYELLGPYIEQLKAQTAKDEQFSEVER